MHVAPPLVISEPELRDALARVGRALAASIDKDC
jgi:acetylornithine/succinyldiaminopimelate/putrescine aminotransferase